jgi:hypothetical protein
MTPLKVIDGLTLDEERKALLRPGESLRDAEDRVHVLPRFFYEVESWEQAKETQLTTHFALSELMSVDCREAPLLLREFPHYVPCAVVVLAAYLQLFRERVGSPVYIATNGGYRSPAHQLSRRPGPHVWGTAANIYRIGDKFLDGERDIEKYAAIAESALPGVFTRPFGSESGQTDDHLHIDIGFVTFVPRDANEHR